MVPHPLDLLLGGLVVSHRSGCQKRGASQFFWGAMTTIETKDQRVVLILSMEIDQKKND